MLHFIYNMALEQLITDFVDNYCCILNRIGAGLSARGSFKHVFFFCVCLCMRMNVAVYVDLSIAHKIYIINKGLHIGK